MAAVEIRDARARWRAAPLLGALVIASATIDVLQDGLAPSLERLQMSVVWLAGLALAVIAARLARRAPRLRATAARWLVIGAGLSAVPSAVELARAANAASHPLPAVWHALLTVRLAPLFPDVNAGGSFFALFTPAAIWMAATARRPWRWGAPAAVLVLALWLTGSRTALASVLVVLPCVWFVARRPGRRTIALASVAAAGLLSWVVFAPPERVPQASSSYALRVRVDMARVAFAIAAEHPLFGVGLGRFQTASIPFISPDLVAYFPPAAVGENAHNNFLQILAELGLAGLGTFLWLLATALRASWQILKRGHGQPELAGLTAGVAAFLLTCLTGHPLLSPPVTLSFLLTLGIMFGLAGETAEGTAPVH